ncbi:hypothetical protein BJY01DRAFT_256256 [Aspergillus pseudoustus]|uniref:Uncharacterized protein n=1 Tax=Aspergillus pseudoustus TaxID=1810923 RepID=A0ABR4IF48_9EURO
MSNHKPHTKGSSSSSKISRKITIDVREPLDSPTFPPLPPDMSPEMPTHGPGLAHHPGGHLHAAYGRIVETLNCESLIEVEPLVEEKQERERLFAPATYEDFRLRSREAREAEGGGDGENGQAGSGAIVDSNNQAPPLGGFFFKPGDVAFGYWVDESRCLRYGHGRVVKVWDEFTVRFCEANLPYGHDDCSQSKVDHGVVAEGKGKKEKGIEREKGKAKEKGKEQEAPAGKRVQFQFPPEVRVFEKDKVCFLREYYRYWREK